MENNLLELFRQLVLLRTYDERSLVYHRQPDRADALPLRALG
jgi:hypothetical protein